MCELWHPASKDSNVQLAWRWTYKQMQWKWWLLFVFVISFIEILIHLSKWIIQSSRLGWPCTASTGCGLNWPRGILPREWKSIVMQSFLTFEVATTSYKSTTSAIYQHKPAMQVLYMQSLNRGTSISQLGKGKSALVPWKVYMNLFIVTFL